ncbi:MAG: glycine cleavage T C-terminal barrel domain-containing protein, partial [Desulfatiglandales bacterium]
EDPHRTPKDGSVIVDSAIRGYVCTARYSLALDQCVGMGMVEDSMAKAGARLEIYEDGCGSERLYGTVVPIPFYDPEGTRLRK